MGIAVPGRALRCAPQRLERLLERPVGRLPGGDAGDQEHERGLRFGGAPLHLLEQQVRARGAVGHDQRAMRGCGCHLSVPS